MNATWLRIQMWLLVLALTGVGLVMIASTTAGMAGGGETLNYDFLVRQVVALVVGLVAAAVISAFGAERMRQTWVVAALAAGTVLALMAVHVLGREVNGAKRWIDLGPVNLQPSEVAKFALVVIAAWHLTRVAEKVRVPWNGVLMPIAGFAVVAGLVYLTKDLGSVVVMAVVLGAMLFFAGARWGYFLQLSAGTLPALCYFAVFQVAYRRDRMLAFLDPMNAEGPAGYHLRQSFIAIGSGGMSGVGLGQSHAKMAFLPEKHTDFIFAVVCEELGLIGAVSVAGLFLALVVTGMFIASATRDRHQRLLAIGATVLLGTQAFWNMLVVVGAVPTKGLTLPFISYGGSSLIISLALIGVLDAVARAAARQSRRTTSQRIGAEPVAGRTWRWQTEGA
ncbi:MAG TPA: putative peptidoglycan glycosyltransferase FtsW [Planctomycetota bacterium]|nr:putative peptidoglycan glycosyltransferase FtsW [Planctomycetota bacterium]